MFTNIDVHELMNMNMNIQCSLTDPSEHRTLDTVDVREGVQGRCLLIKFHAERPPQAENVSNNNSKVLRLFPTRCLYTITLHHSKDKHLVSREKVC